MPCIQARYWLLTIPHQDFTPYLPPGSMYIKGQLESGWENGFLHWQLVLYFLKIVSLSYVKMLMGDRVHAEKSNSAAAEEYVWKDSTHIEGTRFELGKKSIKRNSEKDWDLIVSNARSGKLDEIPGDILVRCYGNLKKIHVDSLKPCFMEREVYVYWGKTGAGKSRLAWQEAGVEAFPKDPNTKFWDGYAGHEHVVMDEYRGSVSISHLLRWLDRYPVIVEVKGSSVAFKATKIWITSNLDPKEWYKDLDEETYLALRRRFTKVVHFN